MTIDERQQPSEAKATTAKATDLAEVPELQFKASAEQATTPDGEEKDKLDDEKDKLDDEKDKLDDNAGKIDVPAREVSTDDYDELSGNNETAFDETGQPIIVTGTLPQLTIWQGFTRALARPDARQSPELTLTSSPRSSSSHTTGRL